MNEVLEIVLKLIIAYSVFSGFILFVLINEGYNRMWPTLVELFESDKDKNEFGIFISKMISGFIYGPGILFIHIIILVIYLISIILKLLFIWYYMLGTKTEYRISWHRYLFRLEFMKLK